MTQITDKIWTMDVPSMAFGLMVNNYGNESELMYMLSMSDISDDDNAEETLITKPLPPGTYRFLFTTKTATEEDARKVVGIGKYDAIYNTYIYPFYHERSDSLGVDSAVLSLNSLLDLKGLDARNNNYALIEKMK